MPSTVTPGVAIVKGSTTRFTTSQKRMASGVLTATTLPSDDQLAHAVCPAIGTSISCIMPEPDRQSGGCPYSTHINAVPLRFQQSWRGRAGSSEDMICLTAKELKESAALRGGMTGAGGLSGFAGSGSSRIDLLNASSASIMIGTSSLCCPFPCNGADGNGFCGSTGTNTPLARRSKCFCSLVSSALTLVCG